MNKPQRRDAPDLSVVRELLGDIPGESIEDAAVRVAARLQAEIDLRRAVEAERDQARKELAEARLMPQSRACASCQHERDQARERLAEARAAVDRVSLEARELEMARDQAKAEAAVANKRRALLLLAARAACKRLRADRNDWRRSFEAAAAVAGGYRSRLAAALARAYDTERLYRRAEDQRAAAESALETLEGQATLAEERAQALELERDEGREALRFARAVQARQRRWIVAGKLRRERDRATVRRLRKEREQLRPPPAPRPLGIALPGWRREDHHGTHGSGWFLLDEQGNDLGAVVWAAASDRFDWYLEGKEDTHQAPTFADAWRELLTAARARVEAATVPPPVSSPGEDLSLPPGCAWVACDCGCGGWLAVDEARGLVGRTEPSPRGWRWLNCWPGRAPGWKYVTPSDAPTARLELAASVRRAFATETPDHCSNDHAFPGAFRALCTRTCSGAGDQPCTGEQSSPEPAGESLADWARAWIDGGGPARLARELADPCSPAQPARPIRAARQARGAGRFPRGGGRPGVSAVSPRGVKGIGGNMYEVAKAGPSPADRESAVNQGERARLGNPECATGALAGGPEPRAGAREGWFGTVGEGERVDPGGALRVAVAVLGAVDLVWWLCVRLLYLCGRRDGEEPGRPGARYLGIGWQRAAVNGGALCEAWIGFVPVDAEPRDGWPVGWRWDASPLEPPGWSFNPDVDDRASQEPGSIGILVRDGGGCARLAFWATAWGDRWTAPDFDRPRLVRLLRAEITDAELRAEERDDTEDYPDDEDDPDALADQEDARIAAIAVLVAYADEIRQRGRVGLEGAPPHGLSDCMHRALAGLTPREREILRQRCPGIPPLAADQRPEDLPDAHEESAPEPVAAECPPATCRTGQRPAAESGAKPLIESINAAELRAEERDDEDDPDAPAVELGADGLPELPEGYTWCAGELSVTISDGSTVVAGAIARAFWWDYAWMPPLYDRTAARASSRAEALRTLAALAWQKERRELVAAAERPPATCRTGQQPAGEG